MLGNPIPVDTIYISLQCTVLSVYTSDIFTNFIQGVFTYSLVPMSGPQSQESLSFI